MATDLYYNADPMLAGPVAGRGGRGQLLMTRQQELEAIEGFNAEIEARAALQDQQLQYGAYSDAQRIGAQQDLAAMDIASRQFMQQQQLAGNFALEGYNQQGQLNYAQAQGEAQAGAYQAQGAAQMAKQIQEAKLQLALDQHEKIADAQMKGDLFTSDEQVQQAWDQFEANWAEYGFKRGLPDQVAQQAAQQEQEVQRQQWLSMLQAPDNSGEMILPEAAVNMLMQMEPDKALGVINKGQSEWRQRKKLEMDSKAGEVEVEKKFADIEADNERAEQTLEHTQQAHQQKLEQERVLAEQKTRQTARLAYQKARQVWAASKNKAGPEGKPADPGPEPKWEDFDPNFGEDSEGGSDFAKMYARLKPGQTYRHPDGSMRVKGGR